VSHDATFCWLAQEFVMPGREFAATKARTQSMSMAPFLFADARVGPTGTRRRV
jgi:hypothetical protein